MAISRNPNLNRIRPVYDGFDSGFYSLPTEMLAARSGVAVLRDAYAAAITVSSKADPRDVRTRLAETLGDAARADGTLPAGWIGEYRDAVTAQVDRSAEVDILSDAVEDAESVQVQVALGSVRELIIDHLRPALEEVLAAVKDRASITPLVPWDAPSKLATADKGVRETFALVEVAAVRYAAIRSAQTSLRIATGRPADNDAWNLLSEVRNLPALWPNHAWQVAGNRPPWPETPTARLVWLASEEVETWLPLPSEVEAAYAEIVAGGAPAQRADGRGVYAGAG